jgi:hypothetical protein
MIEMIDSDFSRSSVAAKRLEEETAKAQKEKAEKRLEGSLIF